MIAGVANESLVTHTSACTQCTLLGACTGWCCYIVLCAAHADRRPVIGILAQPLLPRDNHLGRFGSQYLVASYVKLIEQAGARVVPVQYNQSDADLLSLA